VAEADEILERLEFQNDLRYAKGFDKKTIGDSRRERKGMMRRYRELMAQHSGESGSGWATIKSMGGSSGGLHLIKK
jgi:hypothetical protein